MRCDFCGAPLDGEEKKCPYCGTAVPKQEQPAPPPPAPQAYPQWTPPARPAQAKRARPGCLVTIVVAVVIMVILLISSTFFQFFVDSVGSYGEEAVLGPDESEELPASFSGWMPPGMYKVGADLKPGEYVVRTWDEYGYFEVASDSSGDFDALLYNEGLSEELPYVYIVLEEGQYLSLSTCAALPIDKTVPNVAADGVYRSGYYKVGWDLPAGEYKLAPDTSFNELAYFRLTGTPKCEEEEYVSGGYIEGQAYVTLTEGQYIQLEYAEMVAAQP